MSIKKLLEKVAVGAAVGALVIAGAVGVVNAQRSPYVTGNPQNAALDVKRGSAELPILFNVDLRAVLLAIPNLNPDGFTDSLLLVGATTGDGDSAVLTNSANVGWLFVETNYNMWDILVHRENGGYLVRDPYTGDPAKNFGGISVETCVDVPGPFGSSTEDCSYETVGGKPGVALQYMDTATTGGGIKSLPVVLAVGVVDTSALSDANSIMSNIKIKTKQKKTSILKFDDSLATDYASFAASLKDSVHNGWSSIGYFDPDKVYENSGDSTLFKQITSGPRLHLDTEIGDPYNPVPNPSDPSIVFFINARFKMKAGEYLAGNRNGVYSENLVFTFYGLY